MRLWYAWLLAALVALPARADDAPARITVEVGKTVEREVGYAIGVICDGDFVEAEMKSKSAETNVLVLRGLRAGKTLCRAGTDPNRVSIVFEVIVTPKRKR